MSVSSTSSPLTKTRFEQLRMPFSIVIALFWIAFLICTEARYFDSTLYQFVELAGFFLIFVAVLGRLWCTIYIGGRKNQELCITGPYSLSRNPLYFFSFTGVVGVSFAAQNLTLATVTAILFLAYYYAIISLEEKRLQAMFGTKFLDYASRVPRFIPRLHTPETETTVEVNIRNLARSLKDGSWFLLAIIAIEIVEILRTNGTLTGWIVPY